MSNYDNTFSNEINEDQPALVMFYLPTDPRCVEEAPRMRAAARELEGSAKFIEVNCDERPELKAKYHIHAYPTFILFRDGMEAWRAEGRIPERELDAMVRKFQ